LRPGELGGGRLLVVQPRPGIGDLIWHLPLIHALAAHLAGGSVDLLTKRSTAADVLLAEDPAFGRILWLDRNPPGRRGGHDGPAGILRLAGVLKTGRFAAAIVLHQSASLAMASALAGIPRRMGYGYGVQRLWLNSGPFLHRGVAGRHPTGQAAAYAMALGLPGLADAQEVFVSPAAAAALRAREGALGDWAVLGVGSTEANRCWPPERFAILAGVLIAGGYAGVILLASGAEAAIADAVLRAAAGMGPIRLAVGWPLAEVAALLRDARLFVGNDSGMLNVRVAVGGVAFGLFGVSGPLTHSARIKPIISAAGARAGMESIAVQDALAALRAEGALGAAPS
jgi:heptosyltransferase-2